MTMLTLNCLGQLGGSGSPLCGAILALHDDRTQVSNREAAAAHCNPMLKLYLALQHMSMLQTAFVAPIAAMVDLHAHFTMWATSHFTRF